jgi:rfaE bifunctional protein nucleotidyltransferase chain/domain/rfaE bifunctional protein kinase chain/domain
MSERREPHVVVVGDALLDRDIDGAVERICPDGPAPVLDEHHVNSRPGGAALAATLAARQRTTVTLVSAVGDDEAGATLRRLLVDEGVDLVDLGLVGGTPEKVRLRARGHTLLRLDRGGPPGLRGHDIDRVAAALGRADAVLVSDYGRGITAVPAVREALAAAGAPIVWDPHPKGARPVVGTTVATPNRDELAGLVVDPDIGAGTEVGLAGTAARARHLVALWPVGAVVVTMGFEGALLTRAEGPPLVVPVAPAGAGDPCGAGDCFAATTAVALARGAVLPDAVERAAAEAAAFVERGGAAALTDGAPHGEVAPSQARASSGEPDVVVATGGCFDLLHAGHVSLLQAARALGDRLVVLLNSDRSVARLKGADRPLQGEVDRRQVLLALGCVDDVVVFDEDTPTAALDRLRPDVWVKGGDYAGRDLPEAAILELWGGQAVIVPYLSGRSTTRLVQEARRES